MSLTDMHKSFYCIIISPVSIFLKSFRHKFQRRSDDHTKDIFTILQKLTNRKLPYSVHVLYFSKITLIQINIRNRVNPVKSQNHLLTVRKLFLMELKYCPVFIVLLHQSLRLILIIPEKRIFHLPRFQQCRINIPRHLRRNPFLFLHIT